MAYFLLGVILVGMILLMTPVSLGYNSLEQWLKVRWLGVTITRGLGRKKPKQPKKIPKSLKAKKSSFEGVRLLWRQRDLVRELLQKLLGLALQVYQTLSFRDSEAHFSLPDPMWNGMLYAVLTNIEAQELNLSVNFEERNYAKIWVTVYPYRVMQKLAVFLLHFPYLRTLKLAWGLKRRRQAGC
ncbi:MAG: hypothetical protein ACYDIC_13265 [Desulfobaccales bacterium]